MMASCDVDGEACARRVVVVRDGRGVERRFGICAIFLIYSGVEVLMLEEGGFDLVVGGMGMEMVLGEGC